MDTFHTGSLIRALIVVGTLCVLAIGSAILARREKHGRHRLWGPHGDTTMKPDRESAVMQRSVRYPAHRGRLEANDAEPSAPTVTRRAA